MSEALQDALRDWSVPRDLIVVILSALPISELRGGIPAGLALDLPVWRTYVAAVVANVLAVVPVLLWAETAADTIGRRIRPVGRVFDWVFARARRKRTIVDRFGMLGITLFVAIPLPITGAWTGSVIAVVVGLPFPKAVGCVALGVLIAGTVVTLACLGVFSLFGVAPAG